MLATIFWRIGLLGTALTVGAIFQIDAATAQEVGMVSGGFILAALLSTLLDA